MIDLLDGVAAERIAAAEAAVPVEGEDRDWLSYGVREGFFRATTVQFNGVEAGVLFWHVNDQNRFVLNAAHGENLPVLDTATRRLAQERGCKSVETMTLRPGMVHQLRRRGYKVTGVALSLPL